MGGGGGGKSSSKPAPYVPPPVPAEPETLQEEEASEVRQAVDKSKKAAALASGRQSTIITGSLGATGEANVGRKTLLGQ